MGFIHLDGSRWAWQASDATTHLLEAGAVVVVSSPEGQVFSPVGGAGEASVLCVSREGPSGQFAEQLFPGVVVAQPGAAVQRRLHVLVDLLLAEKVDTRTMPPATRCLVDAFIWSVAESQLVRSAGDQRIQRALALMQARLNQRGTITRLAKQVGLSRAAFSRRFRSAVGTPPEKYFTWIRMQRAAELLLTTDYTLAAIAAEIGYSSEFAFSRAFRRFAGMPPSLYRREARCSANGGAIRCLAA